MFARRSDPAVDSPIVRKSMSYLQRQVDDLLADWIDPSDRRKGIVAREYLPSGKQLIEAAPEALSKLARPRRCPLPPAEVECTRFDDPEKRLAKRNERERLLLTARAIAFFGTPLEIVQQL